MIILSIICVQQKLYNLVILDTVILIILWHVILLTGVISADYLVLMNLSTRKFLQGILRQFYNIDNMLFWMWFCGVMVNISVETVDRKGLTGVAPSTTPYKDIVNNLILLMEFNVSNKIQHICYERMKLMAIRTMINKSIIFRQLNPNIKIIW